ncbi:Hypothetical predicted protein [Lecanosticta acicola]|uniref:Uncharacterized protein n=1 Tax=Lecanosticta acicola TaxID=111012 RepID=A0AAI8YZ76_9PEZI|nr:Hypothetical predicted protein [Lecanosticta acicola]
MGNTESVPHTSDGARQTWTDDDPPRPIPAMWYDEHYQRGRAEGRRQGRMRLAAAEKKKPKRTFSHVGCQTDSPAPLKECSCQTQPLPISNARVGGEASGTTSFEETSCQPETPSNPPGAISCQTIPAEGTTMRGMKRSQDAAGTEQTVLSDFVNVHPSRQQNIEGYMQAKRTSSSTTSSAISSSNGPSSPTASISSVSFTMPPSSTASAQVDSSAMTSASTSRTSSVCFIDSGHSREILIKGFKEAKMIPISTSSASTAASADITASSATTVASSTMASSVTTASSSTAASASTTASASSTSSTPASSRTSSRLDSVASDSGHDDWLLRQTAWESSTPSKRGKANEKYSCQ